jgi:hypothetical protein
LFFREGKPERTQYVYAAFCVENRFYVTAHKD